MAEKSLTYRIGLDIDALRDGLRESGDLTRGVAKDLREMEQAQEEQREAMETAGEVAAASGAAIAAGLGVAVKAAIDWESAFTGVAKTVDGTDAQMGELESQLRSLATTLPASHEEIAAVAEAAGQLGVKREDVAAFTKTMIDMGESTNLTADEAATGMAQLGNVMGTTSAEASRMGSAIVALGNDGASTEKDILEMSQRLAGAGKTAGLATSEVLGIASALSSVGIEAEAGGSAFSKVITDISVAVQSGGKELDQFAEVAGVSAEDFKRAYAENASSGVTSFVAGLGRIQAAGGNTFQVLNDLGYSEVRVRDALLRSANAGDLLSKSIQTGTTAWQQNTALTDEAGRRYATAESRIKVAGNAIKDVAITVGAVLVPAVAGGTQKIAELVQWFGELPAPVRDTVVVLGVAVSVIGLVGGAALIAIPKVMALKEQLVQLAATGGAVGAVAGAANRVAGVLSGSVGIALTAVTVALGAWALHSASAAAEQRQLESTVQDLSNALVENNGAITGNTRLLAANALAATKVGDSGDDVLQAMEKLGVSTKDATEGLVGNAAAADRVRAALQAMAQAQSYIDYQGNTSYTAEGEKINAVLEVYNGLIGARQSNVASAKRQAAAAAETGQVEESAATRVARALGITEAEAVRLGASQEKAGRSATGQASGLDDVGESAADAKSAMDDLLKTLDSFNSLTLDSRAASRKYIEAVQEIGTSLEKNGQNLDDNTEAGRANNEALDNQAEAAFKLAEALLRETGSEVAFRDSLVQSRASLVESAVRMGMTQEAAENYADRVLRIPAVAVTDIQQPGMPGAQEAADILRGKVLAVPDSKTVVTEALTAEAVARLEALGFKVTTLPDGTVQVEANTAAAEQAIANAARPRFSTIYYEARVAGVDSIGGLTKADGGIVRYFAGGGLTEDHVAQIAPAGAWRVWAEPETGGEGYIPLAESKRPRSEQVWKEIGRQFGLWPPPVPVQAFDSGGILAGPRSRSSSSAWSGPAEVVGQRIGTQNNYDGLESQRRTEKALRRAVRGTSVARGR